MPNKKGLYFFSSLLFFLMGLFGAWAQKDKIAFEKYGVAEGLPEEMARYLVQDTKGFIWASSQNGLVKFDGYKIKVFKKWLENETTYQLRNINGGLLISREGLLWIGGVREGGGLVSLDTKTENFTAYPIDFEDPTKVPYRDCLLLFEDVLGNIWFNSYDYSGKAILCSINPYTGTVSRYDVSAGGGRVNDIVLNWSIAESRRDSSLWINTNDDQLMRFDRKKDTFEIILQKGEVIPGTDRIDSIQDVIMPGNSGLIPMGNNRHLYLWDPIKRKAVKTYDFTTRKDTAYFGAFFEDKRGNIWNTSFEEIVRIDLKDSNRTVYHVGQGVLDFEDAPENIRSIVPIYQDIDLIVFEVIGSNLREKCYLQYIFDSETFMWFDHKFNDPKNEFVLNGFGYNLIKDRTGLFWIGTRPNMYKMAPKKRQIKHYQSDSEAENSLHNDTIYRLFEDSKMRLWIGTRNGISRLTAENTFRQYFSSPNRVAKKSLGGIRKIYEDSQGQIWVATWNNGLFRWKENSEYFEPIPFSPGVRNIQGLEEDGDGNLWVVAWGIGVFVLDLSSGEIRKSFKPEDSDQHLLTSTSTGVLFKDLYNQIWLGDPRENDQGLFRYIEEKNQFEHYKFDPEDTLSINSNELRGMGEDDLGRLWVGTDGGLNLYDREKNHFLRNDNLVSLPSISGAAKAGDGRLWVISYSGDGLVLVGPGVNDIEIFGEEKGLLHNDVLGNQGILQMDDLGQIWLPTERGLSVFDTKTRTYSSYFRKDGYQDYNEVNTVARTINGDIWIGGNQGLNHIVPEKLAAKDSTLPSMVITKMEIMDRVYSAADGDLFERAVSFTEELTLDHSQRDLTFEFVALHYLRPEENLYSWKLENYDDDWSEPSKDRQAKYTNLSPGTYTFRVKGSNADGVWNEEGAQLQITINPPWWQTWWAYGAYFLIFCFLGYRFHLFQKARTLARAKEEARAKELEQAKEIKKAYAELKATQDQLIQSEKMASLGELTAGIAHEIQNPLNFVNNFSEVNRELVEELKEETAKDLKTRNSELEQELLTDIDQNLEKISHHGKRADSIVKGMLQHSRSSDGKKEPTNLNSLADEYLRLAYHGLRARDKSFNANMETEFDPAIGEVSIIPQDIGRVLLNLFTNAFHAVMEKKRETTESYEPTVTVRTRKTTKGVEIQVIDNGKGIPSSVQDKIFQPFFTTKKTGEGTGLGLSMSYDIVTKGHNGRLKVESTEGKGAVFIVILPTDTAKQ
ncbi:ATP-binding protein [Robiginitalea sp. IMCC43444]|uniref:ATP-binding protein n=1 Tax=Robiginitalea sp. IMCC43444 TaxID=3459121 RepID=UPI004043453A